MSINMQKRLAAQVLKCSPHRIRFAPDRQEDIKGAITKADIRGLINGNVIYETREIGVSRFHAKKRHIQKLSGGRRGVGKRKGKKTAREPRKKQWIAKVRGQKKFIFNLKNKNVISQEMYKELYRKCKGGFFRSIRHIKIYLNEQLSKKK